MSIAVPNLLMQSDPLLLAKMSDIYIQLSKFTLFFKRITFLNCLFL